MESKLFRTQQNIPTCFLPNVTIKGKLKAELLRFFAVLPRLLSYHQQKLKCFLTSKHSHHLQQITRHHFPLQHCSTASLQIDDDNTRPCDCFLRLRTVCFICLWSAFVLITTSAARVSKYLQCGSVIPISLFLS